MKKETKMLVEEFLRETGYDPDQHSLCLMLWHKTDDDKIPTMFHPQLDHIAQYTIKHVEE